jgi:flagellar basal body-associated protein FliL
MKLTQIKTSKGSTHVMVLALIGSLLLVVGLGMFVMRSDNGAKKNAVATKADVKTPAVNAAKPVTADVKPAANAKPSEVIGVNLDNFVASDTAAETKDADDYAANAINDQTTLSTLGDTVDETNL